MQRQLQAMRRAFARSRRNPAVRAFLSAPSAIFGFSIVFVLIVISVIGDPIWGTEARRLDFTAVTQGVSLHHPLGTDDVGRDILARLLVSTRTSLALALAAAAIAVTLGLTLGVTSALVRPRFRTVVLRAIDTLLSFPVILTAIFISVIVGQGAVGALLGVGIALSFSTARLTSALSLSIGNRDYVLAARVVGVRGPRLMRRYVLPNIAEPLIVQASVLVLYSIISVSALSFVGLGVQPPDFDWGGMLTQGVKEIYRSPAAAIGPAAAIVLAALGFGYTGEALARAMNPLLWAGRSDGQASPRSTPPAPADGAVPDDEVAPRSGAEAVLAVRNLTVGFPGQDGHVSVVKGVSFTVDKGEIVGIVGESGSGKTMTALAIAQLVPYPGTVGGSVSLHGGELLELPRKERRRLLGTAMAVVFQDPMSSLNPALRIKTQMGHPLRVHRRVLGRQAHRLAVDALREVHIPAPERNIERFPHEFSGGMRQRVMIAMGLMREPALLIADEPTTALDVTVQAQIMTLIHEVNVNHGTAIVLISHNLPLISQNCHRVLVMYAGRIVEDIDAAGLHQRPLHPYTRMLLGAAPTIGQAKTDTLTHIPGEAADASASIPGCAYHPRCPIAVDRCRTERPPLRRILDDRRVACHLALTETDGQPIDSVRAAV